MRDNIYAGTSSNLGSVFRYRVSQHLEAVGMRFLDQSGQGRLIHARIIYSGPITPTVCEDLDDIGLIRQQLLDRFGGGVGGVHPFGGACVGPVSTMSIGGTHTRGKIHARTRKRLQPLAPRGEGFRRLGKIIH